MTLPGSYWKILAYYLETLIPFYIQSSTVCCDIVMSDPPDPRELTKLRRRRGVVRASLTRLESRVQELERLSDQPSTVDYAKHLAEKLETLDAEFKSHHLQLIDMIGEDDDDTLEKEQDVLDNYDDQVTDVSIRLKRLYSVTVSPTMADHLKLFSRKLIHLKGNITSVRDTIETLPADHDDMALLEEYQAQLLDYKTILTAIQTELLSVDDQDEVSDQLILYSELEGILFECSHNIRRLVKSCPGLSTARTSGHVNSGVRLPKLDVPTFDGGILHWKQFWEQFCVSVHDRTSLTDAEKLVYLQHALKGGSAKAVIEGLSQSGEQYSEAVQCLVSRFDRPRLIHQTHVMMILETPQLRDGNGKELRRLHDCTTWFNNTSAP